MRYDQVTRTRRLTPVLGCGTSWVASPQAARPAFLRGDGACGTDHLMREAEATGLPYLCKLKQTNRVKGVIEKLFAEPVWESTGQGWEDVDTTRQ